MKNIKAIGFDLFNTLIIVEPDTLVHAMKKMIKSLRDSGFEIEDTAYIKDYKNAAVKFVSQARKNGIETHNSIWVSHVFENYGITVPPEDESITRAVDDYFSEFYDRVSVIPDTIETLRLLKKKYPLGLLSNFTHAPAAREILKRTGLADCFDTIIISGEIGYRKPHRFVFDKLAENLKIENSRILFTGDDPDPDIHGASKAGLQPVWFTYIIDKDVPVIRGTIQSESVKPDIDVPYAASWKEFIKILDS